LITIIIVNWNSGFLLEKCIKSLSDQRFIKHIWVVDNNSSDQSLLFSIKKHHLSIKKIKNNLGFACGNNIALKKCETDFVALLNPDAFPESDWLEKLLQAAEQYPHIAAFGSCQINDTYPEKLDGIGDEYHVSGLVWRKGYNCPTPATSSQSPTEIFSPCAAAALYRRSALEEIGFFDDDYFCYVEDVDLGFRLRLAGYKSIYVPDAVVRHVGSATTGGQQSDFSVYHGHRNLVWTYIKNMPPLLFWTFLPLHLALNIFTIVWFGLRGQGRVILKAKWDAIKGIPKMWKKRQQIQKNRKASTLEIWHALSKSLIPHRHKCK
jgi:GT2 family glycosyltransferase